MERKELLMVVLIGVLLLTTAVQTIALAGLSGGQVTVTGKAVASSPAPSAPSSGTPAKTQSSGSSGGSLANLPSMVGSC